MKVIDAKGRLFGVINIIDLAVLGMIAGAGAMAYTWTTMADDPSWVKVKPQHVQCIGVFTDMPPYVAALVRPGDESRNEDGIVVARIEKVLGDAPVSSVVYEAKDGSKVTLETRTREVTVLADITAYEKNRCLYAAVTAAPLKVGSSIPVTARDYANPLNIRKILSAEER